MKFTDIFIRRPVLATVVSLMILVLGIRSESALPILQYPRTQNAVVTVTAVAVTADPAATEGPGSVAATLAEARIAATRLAPAVGVLKVGLELFVSEGPAAAGSAPYLRRVLGGRTRAGSCRAARAGRAGYAHPVLGVRS